MAPVVPGAIFENSAERKIVTDLSTDKKDKDQGGYSGYASLLAHNLKATSDKVKMDIRNSLRYLLITLRPLRGPSVGVQPPTDAEKSPT